MWTEAYTNVVFSDYNKPVLLIEEAASSPSSQVSVLGCHKHLYNYTMNWASKLTQQEITVHKKGIFQPDSPLIQLTMQQQQLCQHKGDDTMGKRRVKRKFFIKVVCLQKKFGCSPNHSLKICQQNVSWYLILMFRCGKLGLITCSVSMRYSSKWYLTSSFSPPTANRPQGTVIICALSELLNKNNLETMGLIK